MPGRVQGKVAFVTGAARGQGRSHAIRLAQEGADIIAVDIVDQIGSVPLRRWPPPTTWRPPSRRSRPSTGGSSRHAADVRDLTALQAALDDGVAQLGHLDIVSANAGIFSFGTLQELTEEQWKDMIDVNLTGVWHTVKAAIPHLRASGRRVDRPHQLDRRADGDPQHRALRVRQARRRRPDAHRWRSSWRRTTSGSTASTRPPSTPT